MNVSSLNIYLSLILSREINVCYLNIILDNHYTHLDELHFKNSLRVAKPIQISYLDILLDNSYLTLVTLIFSLDNSFTRLDE